MYHVVVRRRIRSLFAAVNQGDAEPVLAAFAKRFEHAFLGEHALGGPATRSPPPGAGTKGSIGFCRTSISIFARSR
jgi:hypothetical protein